MTPEAQRIVLTEDDIRQQRSGTDPRLQDNVSRIAVILGYLFDPMHGGLGYVWVNEKTGERHTHKWFNRYFLDLNACHEMEEALTDDEQTEYIQTLSEITHVEGHWSHTWDQVRATAAQRCEAFLKTKGVWPV